MQCYLKGSHERLLEDIERARREGYHMAAKLVRGAYMQLERERALDRGYPSPIWDTVQVWTGTGQNLGRAERPSVALSCTGTCIIL